MFAAIHQVGPGLRRAGLAAVACGGWFASQSMAVREHLGLGASLVARCNPHLRHTSIKAQYGIASCPDGVTACPFRAQNPGLFLPRGIPPPAGPPPGRRLPRRHHLCLCLRCHSIPGLSASSDVLPMWLGSFPTKRHRGRQGAEPVPCSVTAGSLSRRIPFDRQSRHVRPWRFS